MHTTYRYGMGHSLYMSLSASLSNHLFHDVHISLSSIFNNDVAKMLNFVISILTTTQSVGLTSGEYAFNFE